MFPKEKEEPWKVWYAWRPVRLDCSGKWVWRKYIERQLVWTGHGDYLYLYRPVQPLTFYGPGTTLPWPIREPVPGIMYIDRP